MKLKALKKQRIMKQNILNLLLLTLVSLFISGCASYYVEQGDIQYNAMGYAKAIQHYEKAYAKKPTPETALKIADCYQNINNYSKADKYYQKAFKDGKDIDPIHKLNYGKTLMSLGKYEEAKEQFKSYLTDKPGDFAAQLLMASVNDLGQFMKDTTRYSVKDAGVSGFANVYSPSKYKDGIVVVGEKTERKIAKQNPGTLNSYQDLYFIKRDKDGKLAKPEPLKGKINGDFHEGPSSFNKNGNLAFVTTNNFPKNIKASQKYEDVYNLKVRIDTLKGDEWKQGADFEYSNLDYSLEHPAVSEDGKTLYFASNMPGGLGGFDLYVSRYENGTWSKPENLGAPINTAMDERFPSLADNGNRFYFASNGHKNLGGYDVFMCRRDGSKWLAPINLNYPLNSKADDFGLLLNEDGKTGYYTTNRTGSDRIFEFVINPPVVYAKGKVSSEGMPLAGATVIFENKTTGVIDSIMTDSNGEYAFKLTAESDYTITARKIGFLKRTAQATTKNKDDNEPIVNDFDLIKQEEEKPIVLDLGKVFFDYDKSKLRKEALPVLDNVVNMLNDNPAIRIELGAHTDSRGTTKYNQKLSDKRAKSVYDYLVKKKIDKNRLESKGYGEEKPVNECTDGVKCPEAKHQENRRTEMKIIK